MWVLIESTTIWKELYFFLDFFHFEFNRRFPSMTSRETLNINVQLLTLLKQTAACRWRVFWKANEHFPENRRAFPRHAKYWFSVTLHAASKGNTPRRRAVSHGAILTLNVVCVTKHRVNNARGSNRNVGSVKSHAAGPDMHAYVWCCMRKKKLPCGDRGPRFSLHHALAKQCYLLAGSCDASHEAPAVVVLSSVYK